MFLIYKTLPNWHHSKIDTCSHHSDILQVIWTISLCLIFIVWEPCRARSKDMDIIHPHTLLIWERSGFKISILIGVYNWTLYTCILLHTYYIVFNFRTLWFIHNSYNYIEMLLIIDMCWLVSQIKSISLMYLMFCASFIHKYCPI